jgi:murein DD-endopeptidase MepM/ murein hydrolase activator NlpD
MRHASKVALRVSVWALVAIFSVLVPIAMLDIAMLAPTARALDSTGGTSAPAIAGVTDAVGLGGTVAPGAQGTGGSEYGVVVPKPKAVPKPPAHKPSHAARRTPATPKSKAPVKTKAKPKPAGPAPATTPAGVPTPAQTVAEGAVFPVVGAHSFGGPENRFGAAREGHIHEGQDVLASEGLQVVAPLAGTIITTAYQAGGAGWYAAEQTVDGLDFFYAHCQASSLAVSADETIKAGQVICRVGQTGDATGPHLHLEIWVGGWQAKGGYPIDPLPYLEAWEAAGG